MKPPSNAAIFLFFLFGQLVKRSTVHSTEALDGSLCWGAQALVSSKRLHSRYHQWFVVVG